MQVMNDITEDLASRIVEQVIVLMDQNMASTVSAREIQTAVRLVFSGELAKHAVSEGTKAVVKYTGAMEMKKTGDLPGRSTMALKSGLTFPVSRFLRYLKSKTKLRVNKAAPVYMAATLEYYAAEILELSGNAARDNKRVRIVPRHIMLAIHNDAELSDMAKGTHIKGAGVLPSIHWALMPESHWDTNQYNQSQDFESDQGFGSSPSQGAPLFGNKTSGGLFGNNQGSSNNQGFGNSNQGSSLFGNQSSGIIFGNKQRSFENSNQGNQLFGNQSSGGLFGNNQGSSNNQGFGNSNQGSSLFGNQSSGGLFGV
eukprot:TRINITY_DN1059_c0_g1_i2.p1 TRINITY_DN1059_c0_g1~~TRINITY_DN1059_c0_g1_i2.p1  ORF type:complete len:312 (-),score=67.59 TRINITY_DN1059_c0_g1_i2:66-1001(-)